jgi:AcrR family transcriptional regulator
MGSDTQPRPDRKQELLDAALALADEKGLDAVSMRAVAQRAGLTAMALYPHVGTKAALLDGMMGRLLSRMLPDEAGPAAPGRDWRERLRHLAWSARSLVREHPWAAGLLFSRPSATPESARTVDQIYTALLDAGVPAGEVPRLERMLSTVILGYAASEAGGRFPARGIDSEARRALAEAASAGELPGRAQLIPWLERPADWDAEFEADLDDLVRLIEIVSSG